VAREEAAKLGIKGKSEISKDSPSQAAAQTIEMGTGFFVTSNGYILTDFHVVTGAHLIQIKNGKGVRTAKLVARDPINDIAVLKVDEATKCLPLGDSGKVTLGQSVFTVGFPNPDVQGLSPKLTKGEVSSLAGLQDDPRMYQISAPVQPGNSGGCLVDDAGNVVGIISSKLNAVAMANATGDVPQNVNYALKISYAKLLLDTLPDLKTGFAPPNTAAVPFDKDVNTVQDSTIMVIAQ
jgi:S1-C subfamily serine protease